MIKTIIFFIFIFVFFCVAFIINHNIKSNIETEIITMERPENIPQDAVFRGGPDGGFFINLRRNDLMLTNGNAIPAYELGVYWPDSGDIEFEGIALFVSDREISSEGEVYYHDPPPVTDIISTAYYNGSELQFDVNGLSHVARLIPLNLDILD